MKNYIEKKVLVRANMAGVYFGTLKGIEGSTVTLGHARNIWYWSGANSLMELSTSGVKNPNKSKFSVWVDEIVILDVCAIIPCTQKAVENIEAVKEWKF